jgi:hypothetical protein
MADVENPQKTNHMGIVGFIRVDIVGANEEDGLDFSSDQKRQ